MDGIPQKDPTKGPEDEPGIPHFQRRDSRYIDYEPSDELWDILPQLEEGVLEGLGLQPWDEERKLWLFPVEWYEHIPEGMEITTINGEQRPFDRDEDIKEGRFGALPYGISKGNYESEHRQLERVEQ